MLLFLPPPLSLFTTLFLLLLLLPLLLPPLSLLCLLLFPILGLSIRHLEVPCAITAMIVYQGTLLLEA